VIVLLSLATVGCDQDPGAPGTSAISAAEAQALAQTIAVDLDGLQAGAVYDPTGDVPFGAPSADRGDWACVTRSPDPVVNSDGDHVPDSVRLTYTDCVFSRPTATVEIDGIIDILDLNPTVPDHSIKWVLTDFTRAVTHLLSGGTTTTVENGTRLVSATSSVLQHELIDFTSEVTFPNGSTASHEKDWATTFTADVEGSIARRQPLPSGTWVINGTSTWTHGERSASLDVSTEVPLHYNAECTEAPKFDAGRLVIVFTRGDRSGTITIEYTACGEYTVTRS
jgi:hypothetical protein